MRYLLTLLLLVVPTCAFAEEETSFLPTLKRMLAEKTVVQQLTQDEAPHPFFAQKYLRGDAWAAWAIQHNNETLQRAKDTAVPGTEVQVQIGNPYYPPLGGYWHSRNRYYEKDVYKSYSYTYGGGSVGVILYNPYVQPKEKPSRGK